MDSASQYRADLAPFLKCANPLRLLRREGERLPNGSGGDFGVQKTSVSAHPESLWGIAYAQAYGLSELKGCFEGRVYNLNGMST